MSLSAVPDVESLGLSEAEIAAEDARWGTEALARRISGRGSTAAHLHRIAWHGSALADIGCPPGSVARTDALLDAALFNLAVALTDSVVDDEPHAAGTAAEVLDPDGLRRRLLAPTDPRASIAGEADGLGGLYRIWDLLLVRLGRRFAEQQVALARLASLLQRMHSSEFDARADRLPAKLLPIEFIGALLPGGSRNFHEQKRVDGLYRELGELIGLSDDWSDLPSDMRHMRANRLVSPRDGAHGRLGYARRCAGLVLRQRRLVDAVATEFGERLSRVVALAGLLDPEAAGKASAYVGGLLECD